MDCQTGARAGPSPPVQPPLAGPSPMDCVRTLEEEQHSQPPPHHLSPQLPQHTAAQSARLTSTVPVPAIAPAAFPSLRAAQVGSFMPTPAQLAAASNPALVDAPRQGQPLYAEFPLRADGSTHAMDSMDPMDADPTDDVLTCPRGGSYHDNDDLHRHIDSYTHNPDPTLPCPTPSDPYPVFANMFTMPTTTTSQS